MVYKKWATTGLLLITRTTKANSSAILVGLLFAPQIVSISYVVGEISQQPSFSVTMAVPGLLNQAWLLKRENRQELLYIFFLTLSNLRLSFLAQRPRKCARQCSNAWRCPNARQCLNVKSLSIFLIPPQQLNFCQTMFPYETSDCSGKSTISPEGYVTSNSAKTPYMS